MLLIVVVESLKTKVRFSSPNQRGGSRTLDAPEQTRPVVRLCHRPPCGTSGVAVGFVKEGGIASATLD